MVAEIRPQSHDATQANTASLQPTHQPAYGQPRHAPKRQRRPSVRLGEIGHQPVTLSYEASAMTRSKPQSIRQPKASSSSKLTKAPPIVSLENGNDEPDSHESEPLQNGDVGFELDRRGKGKRGNTKRGKSIWVSKIDNHGGEGIPIQEEEEREELRETNPDSDSQMKLQESPLRSIEGVRLGIRETGVKSWLIDLGLGKYGSVFDVHEVDDDVLPFLTLEDLKDMGINAVGSRRKLYSAIEKLRSENA